MLHGLQKSIHILTIDPTEIWHGSPKLCTILSRLFTKLFNLLSYKMFVKFYQMKSEHANLLYFILHFWFHMFWTTMMKTSEKVTLKNIVKLCRWHKTATMGLTDESRGVKNLVTRPLYRQFPQTFTTVFCKKKSLVKCKLCAANSILTTIHDSIMMIQ